METVAGKPPVWLGPARLAIGLAQGLIGFWLARAEEADVWPSTNPAAFAAIASAAVFAPVMLQGSLGALRPVALAVWMTAATLLLGVLGWHGAARVGAVDGGPWPMGYELPAFALIVFVAHHLVAASDEARRLGAPYERYFDLGVRHAAQLALACAFVGALWALLTLASQLFALVEIRLLRRLMEREWFAFCATTAAFAAAVHLTDVRSGLVNGLRALGLALLAWLLPLMTLLIGAFLAALPFITLKPLWATGSATAILLGAAATLIVLINAAYQDGGSAASRPAVLRWSARVAALLLAPLVGLAGYAVFLRVGQHGLTPDRVVAIACVAVAALLAGGYAWAAVAKPWLKPIEITNLGAAVLAVVLATALFTPIADPARLAVADQVRRLKSGAVAPDAFDFVSLRYDGLLYGLRALERLRADADAEIARRAAVILTYGNADRWRVLQDQENEIIESSRRGREPLKIEVYPAEDALPEDFLSNAETENYLSECREDACVAVQRDLDGDGVREILVAINASMLVYRHESGRWRPLGRTYAACGETEDGFAAGDVEAIPPVIQDVRVGGWRYRVALNQMPCVRADRAP
jgi:hypothetical protein